MVCKLLNIKIMQSYSRRMCTQLKKPLIFSVPQGSVAGLVLYNAYASTLKEVVSSSIELHGFADDHMIKDSFKPIADQESRVIQTLGQCTSDIKDWMDVQIGYVWTV